MSGADDPQDLVAAARQLWRQGLLQESAHALAGIRSDAPASQRASAELLAGNIAFERGDDRLAAEAWGRAATLFRADPSGAEGAAVAADNLAMAEANLARQEVLHHERTTLQWELAGLLTLAALAVAVACRRSARAEPHTA